MSRGTVSWINMELGPISMASGREPWLQFPKYFDTMPLYNVDTKFGGYQQLIVAKYYLIKVAMVFHFFYVVACDSLLLPYLLTLLICCSSAIST